MILIKTKKEKGADLSAFFVSTFHLTPKDHPNPGTSADGIIVLYDEAFTQKYNLARILGHELAHQKYLDLSSEDRMSYQSTTNWLPFKTDTGTEKYYSRTDGFVADDGRESPEEDFANNVEFYLFERGRLKRLTPHADRWIAEHYGKDFKIKGKK